MNRSSVRREAPPRFVKESPLSVTEILVVTTAEGRLVRVEVSYTRTEGCLLLYRARSGVLSSSDLRAIEEFTQSLALSRTA